LKKGFQSYHGETASVDVAPERPSGFSGVFYVIAIKGAVYRHRVDNGFSFAISPRLSRKKSI
jgi:hypothetical protein